jgi:hypothetical protein
VLATTAEEPTNQRTTAIDFDVELMGWSTNPWHPPENQPGTNVLQSKCLWTNSPIGACFSDRIKPKGSGC